MPFALKKHSEPSLGPKPSHETDEWFRLIRLTKTKGLLGNARRVFEAIELSRLEDMIQLGMRHLREHLEVPSIKNNLRHVEEQLLLPVVEDAKDLAATFGIDPTRFRALVVLHDLGKAGIPPTLKTLLKKIFPDDYVAREILTHEYASMLWIEKLAPQARLTSEETLALQRLIANHNFGPDLCDAKHKNMRAHWWPKKFREKIFPVLKQLGFDLSSTFEKSEDGEWQYNHAEDDVYAALLAAYDRAIATKYNSYGVATWQKFAQQDYLDWKAESSSAPSPFNAVGLTENMQGAVRRARIEIEVTWRVLAGHHLLPEVRKEFRLETFPPYRRQVEGVIRLLDAIHRVTEANPHTDSGSLIYINQKGETWKVEDHPRKAQLKHWDPTTKEWTVVAEDQSPIKLYFQVLEADL